MLAGLDTQDDRRMHRTPSSQSVAGKLPDCPAQGRPPANILASLLDHTVLCCVHTLMENPLPEETSNVSCFTASVTSGKDSQVSTDPVLFAERSRFAREGCWIIIQVSQAAAHSPAGPPVGLTMCSGEALLPSKPPPQHSLRVLALRAFVLLPPCSFA